MATKGEHQEGNYNEVIFFTIPGIDYSVTSKLLMGYLCIFNGNTVDILYKLKETPKRLILDSMHYYTRF